MSQPIRTRAYDFHERTAAIDAAGRAHPDYGRRGRGTDGSRRLSRMRRRE